jgi:sulfofructose kinase
MKFPFDIERGRTFDVLGFGTNAVDFLITVPKFPAFSSKVELSGYERAPGGEIASTMVGLQRLGMRTAYSGSFGGDDAGDFGIACLEKEGIELSFSKRVPGAQTQIAFIVIDEETGERTVIWKRDPMLGFVAGDAPVEAVLDCGILHMTPHDTAACIRLADGARKHRTVVSLDIDNVFDRIDELLPLVDILIGASEFPFRITGIHDERLALIDIQKKFGNTLVGMTLGDNGSLLLCNGEFIETPGFDVPGGCKDTTGAGDAFRVGFLYGLLNEKTVGEAARMANAVAALKCRAVGARTALPNASELDAFLRNS